MIEPDDFAVWRESPITQTLFKALRNMAAEAKAKWNADSWEMGFVDERVLADLRATAKVCNDICELTLDEMEEKASVES